MLHILQPKALQVGGRGGGQVTSAWGRLALFGGKEKTHCALNDRMWFHSNHKNRSLPTDGEEVWLFQELRDEMREAQSRTPGPAERAAVSGL